LLGGRAAIANPDAHEELGVDYLLKNFQDIKDLSRGVE
jgi:hypothetical protein